MIKPIEHLFPEFNHHDIFKNEINELVEVVNKLESHKHNSFTGVPVEQATTTESIEKSCDNCNNNNNGYCPIGHTCGTIKDEPDKWTPIVDKVEEDK